MDETYSVIALIRDLLGSASNLMTIVASGIAIYIFFFKKKEVIAVYNLLVNYSHQLTLSELKEKLERLNDNNVNDEEQKEKVICILNEFMGQVRGNEKLKKHFSLQLKNIDKLLNTDGLTEPRKRALVSELREKLRHLNITNLDDLMGDVK